MSQPVANFLTPEGLAKFASGDQDFFLQAAVDMIRHFCGWHISPSVTVTGARLMIGSEGLVTMPSRYVTSVSDLSVNDHALAVNDGYLWEAPRSWIQLKRKHFVHPFQQAVLTYVHGYDEIPADVEAIGYELVQQARSKPGGNSKDVGAGPYRVTLLKLGVGLDEDQMNRLRAAGVVRPGIA